MRCEYQVIVIPYIKESLGTKFLVMKRTDDENWQFISGGGENSETPIDAAKREAIEEANIETSNEFYALDTIASIPKYHFREHRNKKNIYVIESKILFLDTQHFSMDGLQPESKEFVRPYTRKIANLSILRISVTAT